MSDKSTKTQINWTKLHAEAVEEFQRLYPLLYGPQNITDEQYAPTALTQASRLIACISNDTPATHNSFIENLPLFVACAIGRDTAEMDADDNDEADDCDCDECIERQCEENDYRYYNMIVEDGEINVVETTLDDQEIECPDLFGDAENWVEFSIERPGVFITINTSVSMWAEAVAIMGDEESVSDLIDSIIDGAA